MGVSHHSHTWTRSVLQSRGLLTKAPKRSVHRKKRVRRPLSGMMLFQDGSGHAWLPRGPELDLIVIMDDATSRILSIFLVEEEGTASTFRGLKEAIRQYGLFSSFYTDRGSHSFVTAQAGGKVDRLHPTQVGRAFKHLGIEEERVVAHDDTVRYERRILQIPERSRRPPFVKAKVRIHEDPDGTLAMFHGPRRPACYTAEGTLLGPGAVTRSAA